MMWTKKYELNDLNLILNAIKTERFDYKIVIIDDQNITLVGKLKSHGFNVTHLKDVENLYELKNFNIIICDIQGVGKKLGSKFEGAHLISEIKKEFPLKYLIAFSGKSFDPTYNKYFSLCDDVMQKRSDITDWVVCLELAIKKNFDPIYNWEVARKILIQQKMPLNTISKLEQAFIKSIIKKDTAYYNRLIQKNNNNYSNVISTLSAIGTYLSFFHSLTTN